MLSQQARNTLEKQHYKLVGEHSAVKTCYWTKAHIKGEGGCYKLTFYGIMSNQCMQMTTSISCANRCTFCWRGYKAPVSKEWKWNVDDPKYILQHSLEEHEKFLLGFGGNPYAIKNMYEKSKTVKHVALSLTGEPIIYPKINEICAEFHKQGISTFIVTNAQYPQAIKDLKPITQLYISVDAPNKKLLKEIDVPLFADYWERLNESLENLKEKEYRTCIRMTMIKGLNDVEDEGYKALIEKGDPDFIEIKGYMFVGESQNRLKITNMPMHEEVVEYAKRINNLLDDYDIVTEHVASRVVLLAKKIFKKEDGWYTWIDFDKFHKLANSNQPIRTDDFLIKTPKVGLSNKTSQTHIDVQMKRKKARKERFLNTEQGKKQHPRVIGTA